MAEEAVTKASSEVPELFSEMADFNVADSIDVWNHVQRVKSLCVEVQNDDGHIYYIEQASGSWEEYLEKRRTYHQLRMTIVRYVAAHKFMLPVRASEHAREPCDVKTEAEVRAALRGLVPLVENYKAFMSATIAAAAVPKPSRNEMLACRLAKVEARQLMRRPRTTRARNKESDKDHDALKSMCAVVDKLKFIMYVVSCLLVALLVAFFMYVIYMLTSHWSGVNTTYMQLYQGGRALCKVLGMFL